MQRVQALAVVPIVWYCTVHQIQLLYNRELVKET
jgi:hypothetical protein